MPTCTPAAPRANAARTASGVADPAGGHHRLRGFDQLQQRQQPDGLEVGPVNPRSAMPARLSTLDDEDIGVRGRPRLLRARHGHPRLAGQVRKRIRAAERVRHRRDRLAREQRELRVPGVVVPARVTQIERRKSA